MRQPRSADELKKAAVIYWPDEIKEKEADGSIIPLFIATQDSFIDVLQIANKDPYAWVKALSLDTKLYPALFLKYLCVISDMGGESLKRFATELPPLFKDTPLHFEYKDVQYEHPMRSLFKGKKWSNTSVERKAKQAEGRMRVLHEQGHTIAYVVDGAGNFERKSFIQDLIDFSDCTVTFSNEGIKRLARTMENSIS